MKRFGVALIAFLVSAVSVHLIWGSLPLTISRHSDIKFGNSLIVNIEAYKKANGLPVNYDWDTLRRLGFRDKIDFLQPEYNRVDSSTFELIYAEGLDGPFLIWNSKERVWKRGYPTFLKKTGN